VPTSLRGLNAWLAHFSSALAPACITADPYAVLRYGNAETLPLEQARILLRELSKLSNDDPYFRAEDWSRHPAAGLMRVELEDDILALLFEERTQSHLTFLLLEAMAGSPIVGPLGRHLEAVMFDPDRLYGARSRAADALTANGALGPIKPVIERLLALGDSDSQRIAFEILARLGLAATPMYLTVQTLLAHAGLTVSPLNRKQRKQPVYIPRDLFTALSAPELQAFLDNLADYATPLMRDRDHRVMEGIVDGARTAVLITLQSGAPVTPNHVWRWLRWVRGYYGYDTETKKALRRQFEDNVGLRRGIQAAALLSAPVGELRSKAFDLRDVSVGLLPDDEDVIALIDLLGAGSGGVYDLQQLCDLVSLARTRSGLSSDVREAALKIAGADPALIRDLDEGSKPIEYDYDDYERKQKRRLTKDEAKRQKTYREIRKKHAAAANDIRVGDFRWLNQIAEVYLGRISEFSKDDKPEVRVEKFLGADLAGDALEGFMAALHRSDLPSAAEIAQSHAEVRQWSVEIVLVCGIAEMIRRDMPLDTVPRPALVSAYMAWRRQNESNIVGDVEIGPGLEAIVLADEAQADVFFRTSIEPQLRAGLENVYDLYLLTNGHRWPALAGKLAVEWLIQNPTLSPAAESELLDVAVRHGDRRHLTRLVDAGGSRLHANIEALLEWLATDFVIDFDRAKPHLADAAREDRHFLWRLRRRAAGGRHESVVPVTIAQRAFVVQAFGATWPQTGRPEGCSSGDTNPWDASDVIERAIYSIAAEPAGAATETLQRLLSDTAPT